MAITVITFDLDNTLWDVEPALLRAEEAQRKWLLRHRPGTMEAFDHEGLWEFKKSVWKRHPQLLHHVSDIRRQMLYELQRAAGFGEEESREGAQQAFAAFLEERHKVILYEEALGVLRSLSRDFTLGALESFRLSSAFADVEFVAADGVRVSAHSAVLAPAQKRIAHSGSQQ